MASSPSIVPQSADHITYRVLNDFGSSGALGATDSTTLSRKALIRVSWKPVYHPVRIVRHHPAEGCVSLDFTVDICPDELRRRFG